MNCNWVSENLCDILDGLLTPDAERELSSHIKACGACSELLSGLQSDKELLADLGDVAVPPSLGERVLLEIRRPVKSPWKFFVPRLAPVAAAILITVFSLNTLPRVMVRDLSNSPESFEASQQRVMTASDATSGSNVTVKSAPANEIQPKQENFFTDSTALSLAVDEKPMAFTRSFLVGGTVFVLWGAVVYYWYKKQ